jgi:TRAP-type C4-dicarboxylate transport system substrate-binding protein
MNMRQTPVLLLLALSLTAPALQAQEYTIKFATVAPEGTTWMNTMREFDAAIRKESGGRLGFKIYAGGVQGEDKDVMRRIRRGQLHSAGITGFGIGEISPALRILDAPFLFRNHAEVDYLHEKFDAEFASEFEANGFVLLGWAEVGFAYVFTNTPVRKPEDLGGTKMWMWEGDPVAEAAFRAMGVTPIPLSLIDVLTSLQTGLIDAAYGTPLSSIAMQWYTRVKYMTHVPLANVSGAVVIAKKKFDELPPDLQEILRRNGKTYMEKLTRLSRKENDEAIGTLQRNGVEIIEITDPALLRQYAEIWKKARESLAGVLYSRDLLDRVEGTLREYRQRTPERQ